MNWTEMLELQVEETYRATEGLLDHVEEDHLDWKPETGTNWMTTGQLLEHITTACGFCCKGFVTGDWGMPEGMSFEDMSPAEMIPPAEAMPAATSVADVKKRLAADKQLALEMIHKAGEKDLAEKEVKAPWSPKARPLGYQLSEMVGHLGLHKAQLFYYLKLQGKPVGTKDLWGM